MSTVTNTAVSFEAVPRGSIREAVVRSLLIAVMRGHFPAGQRMIVQRLTEQLGVSATPVREALVELAAIGIVENSPNRGAVMREFGPAQIREIYQLRRLLEVEAVRCACGRVDTAELEDLKREFAILGEMPRDGAWSQRAMEGDLRLHALIATHCASGRLRDEIDRYNTLVQVIREVVDNERDAQEIALAEHLQIIRALLADDADAAAAAMAQHIDSTAELVVDTMPSPSEHHENRKAR